MKFMIKIYFLSLSMLLLSLAFTACQSNEKKTSKQDHITVEREALIRTNKYLLNKDDEVIRSYVNRRQWKVNTTNTGLHYMIYQKGEGPQIRNRDKVKIRYDIELIDGTPCYDNKEIVIEMGHSDVESGLQQGLLMMGKGDKAKLIIPPHLGFGLIGDEKKIPARSTLVYDVEVLEIL